ncbi:MAG: hypothetical protein IKY06_09290, partial [Clostridia bacterium]|nr:hypothetical protein [Clostridia bacterium]
AFGFFMALLLTIHIYENDNRRKARSGRSLSSVKRDCRSEQVPSVSDLARSHDICGEGYSIQIMLQLKTPPVDQRDAGE